MNSQRNAVGWFEIYVDDLPRAQAFYEKVFEIQLQKLPDTNLDVEMLMFNGDGDRPGAAGALVKMEGTGGGMGGTIVYFTCEDCAQEESRVAPGGGSVFKTKFSIGQYGFISLVKDTEDNVIGLHSMR